MAYATVAELKADINLDSTSDDTTLARLLDAASSTIDHFCNRPDGFVAPSAATCRYYVGDGSSCQRIDECVAITSVAVKDSPTDTAYTAWTSPTTNMAGDGDWVAFSGERESPNYNDTPYTGLLVDPNGSYSVFTNGAYVGLRGFPPAGTTRRNLPTVRVTARWGYAVTAPAAIKSACVMQTARWYKRLQSSMADVLASGEMGMLMYRQELDPDIKHILVGGRYVRPAVGRR